MIRVTIIRQGDDEAAEVKEFLSAQISIGRVGRNDLVLVNSRVSSVHARAIEAEHGITLIDENSTNGTFVNGELVHGPVAVEPHDTVEIGSFTLHFESVAVDGEEHVDEEPVSEIAPSEFEEFGDEPAVLEPDLLPLEHTPQDAFMAPESLQHDPGPSLEDAPLGPSHHSQPALSQAALLRGSTMPDERIPTRKPRSRREPAPAPQPAFSEPEPPPYDEPYPEPQASAPQAASHHRGTLPYQAAEQHASHHAGAHAGSHHAGAHASQPEAPTGLAGAFERTVVSLAVEGAAAARTEARALVHARAAVDACCPEFDPRQRRQWSEWIAREVVGVGPLTDLLADASVSEVLVRGATSIDVCRDGVRVRHPTRFSSERALVLALQRLVGAAPTEQSPVVNGVVGTDVTLHAVGRPLVHVGPVVILSRPQAGPRTLADLVAQKQLGQGAAEALEAGVQRGANVLVCGPSGLDTSNWLAAIAAAVPAEQRIVAVHRGLIGRTLAERAIVLDGARDVAAALRSALRLQPDCLVVHELGGVEAMDVCASARRGSGSTIASLAATSPEGALVRLQAMVSLGVHGDPAAIRGYVAGCFDLVLALRDNASGRVVAGSLAEVRHAHNGEVVELFAQDA